METVTQADIARSHFANRLAVETDVSDVAAALAAGEADFVLLDSLLGPAIEDCLSA